MKAEDAWLQQLVGLVKKDKELHDATVKLILAAAENELSKSEARRARTRSKRPK